MSWTNRSKRYAASCGPAAASGWYWTEKAFSAPPSSRSSSPSTTSSLRQTWLTVATPYGVWVPTSSGASDGEAVVVRGHLDLAGGAVHDGLVDAAVAVLELVGAEPERPAEQLVAEADPEVGDPLGQRASQQLDLAGGRGRVAGAVGVEEPVRADRPHVVDGRGGRQHVHLDAALGHPVRGHRLDAEVEGGDGEPLRPDRGDDIGLPRGDLLGELGSGHLGLGADPLQQRVRVGLGGGDPDPHRPALAQVPGQRAGVDAGDADHALRLQLVVEAAPRPPVAGDPGRVADDVAGHPDPRRLLILVVDAGVADVRRGHHHDLAVVRRVGERLLVAGHAGVEDRLAEGLALGAVALAVEGATVLEDQDRWGKRGQSRSPSPPHWTVVKGCRSAVTLPARDRWPDQHAYGPATGTTAC